MFASRVVLPSATAAEKPKSRAVIMAVAMAVVVVRTKKKIIHGGGRLFSTQRAV